MKQLKNNMFETLGGVKFLVCCCVLFIVFGVYSEDEDNKLEEDAKKFENTLSETRKQRQKEFEQAEALISQGKSLAMDGKYADAMGNFQKAQAQLEAMDGDLAKKKIISLNNYLTTFKNKWADSIMDKARRAAVENRYEDAINLASEAVLVDPNRNASTVKFIEQCKSLQKSSDYRSQTSLDKINPEYAKTSENIDLLYREAEVLYKNKRYVEVRTKLEKIFLQDPYNLKAIHLLNKTYDRLYEYAEKRRLADVEEMIAYNTWQWNEAVLPTQFEREVKKGSTIKSTGSAGIYEKMENIIFPGVEFDDADIFSVIRYLHKNSKRYDPDQEGISIVSGFTKKQAEALPKITMSFAKIPMSEVLRYLCQGVGLKYKIDEGSIVIGANVDEMQTDYFPIRGDLISDITGIKAESTTGGGGGGGGGAGIAGAKGGGDGNNAKTLPKAGETMDLTKFAENEVTPEVKDSAMTSAALKKYFGDRGIKFGSGTSIAYDRRGGKLIIKNSLENLRKMDELLRQIDAITTPLVMVETKVVDIAQNDVEELGFDWVYAAPYNPSNPYQDHPTWWVNEHPSGTGQINEQGTPLRHYSEANPNSSNAQTQNYKVINDLKILPNFGESIFGQQNQWDLSLTVNAISQNSRTEVLSTPRLLTTSGSEATIKMITQYYYPSSWTAPVVTVNGSTVSITAPVPEFDEATDIGVLLTIKPVVNPDNYTITLSIIPQILKFVARFPNETIKVTTGQIDSSGKAIPTFNNSYSVWMPEIGRNDLNTNVKVYDGETIVLGGMISNRSVYRDDKWPVLGDVPLVGRLFSSQLAMTEKRNMIIFVTTRLINNDGIPVRRNKQRSVPEFYR
jgi:type II secretory pathway component GspD/PulD (secretin)/tetratricopeptide (TPR) repeat protein